MLADILEDEGGFGPGRLRGIANLLCSRPRLGVAGHHQKGLALEQVVVHQPAAALDEKERGEAASHIAVTVNLRLGDVMPLLSSATGRCFAAYVSREAIAPLLREEMARARQLGRTDLPRNQTDLNFMLRQVREHGLARAVDSLLPGVAGFCAPVFDFDGHLVLGMVAMGSVASFDTAWDGSVATPLQTAARQLSAELGHRT